MNESKEFLKMSDPIPNMSGPAGVPLPDFTVSGSADSDCSIKCAEVNCGSPVMPTYDCGSLTCPALNIGDIKCGDVQIGNIYCSNVQPPVYSCPPTKCPEWKFPEYKCPGFSCPNLPTCPQCIDTSMGVIVMIIALVSLMAILFFIYKWRRNRILSMKNNRSMETAQHNVMIPLMTNQATHIPMNSNIQSPSSKSTDMVPHSSENNQTDRMPNFILMNQELNSTKID